MSVSRSRYRAVLQGFLVFALTAGALHAQQASTYRLAVSFTNQQSAAPLDGRDVDAVKPGQSITLDDAAFGYPVRYLHDVPAGDYFVQVVLNEYETFHRADGTTVKLPMDRGEGQHWQLAPGNLYSTPRKITLQAGADPVAIVLHQGISPIPDPKDPPY